MNPLAELLGESPGIVAVRQKIGQLLQRQTDARRLPPILLQGETGTGKRDLVKAIHDALFYYIFLILAAEYDIRQRNAYPLRRSFSEASQSAMRETR